MSEQEVREALKLHRWSFVLRERGQRRYIYAARKWQGKRQEVYITPLTELARLTLGQLMTKMRIASGQIGENVHRSACVGEQPDFEGLENARSRA